VQVAIVDSADNYRAVLAQDYITAASALAWPSEKAAVAVEVEMRTIDPEEGTFPSEPAANTDAVVTLSALGTNAAWVIEHVWAFYTGGSPSQKYLVVDSNGVRLRYPMPTVADSIVEIGGPIFGQLGQSISVTLPAGGVGISGRLYVSAVKTRKAEVV